MRCWALVMMLGALPRAGMWTNTVSNIMHTPWQSNMTGPPPNYRRFSISVPICRGIPDYPLPNLTIYRVYSWYNYTYSRNSSNWNSSWLLWRYMGKRFRMLLDLPPKMGWNKHETRPLWEKMMSWWRLDSGCSILTQNSQNHVSWQEDSRNLPISATRI